MKLLWKCRKPDCRFEVEGTAESVGKVLDHQRRAKSQGEGGQHEVVLVDAKTGEIFLDEAKRPVRSLPKAQKMGLIPQKPTAPELKQPEAPALELKQLAAPALELKQPPPVPPKADGAKTKPKTASAPSEAMKGKIKPIEVDLDPRLHFLYEWDKAMFPAYQGTFSEWVWECMLGFHIQNQKAFQLNRLFQEAS